MWFSANLDLDFGEVTFCLWILQQLFCVYISSGGQLAKIEDLHTNIYIGSEVHIADSSIEHYWIGTYTYSKQ